MAVDGETVRKAARLARIEVQEAELEPLAAELSGILGWVEQLQEVNVDGVEPMTSVTPMALKRREDDADAQEQTALVGADRILAAGPEVKEGFYVVPKVVE